ncbi:PREDICTED: F-box/WD repeat-containing protein 4 [Atta colombica]|uniref:F-box/WD repeat-containing protein 4 n=1 Tax=Atta colombica TaxID=520822 RepID=UPI00084C7E56|nr:PREDICTED: F-box/WD repeat-containing protein 4 [Atta colombica]XP_018047797.1 PREDICTED: F-box/WD repeat-containing protein 4 [Atta colombica]
MTDTWRLDILPNEMLLSIFNYCNAYDLIQLSQVCKRFYRIISDTGWNKKRKSFLVTNQTSEMFRKRCFTLLQPHAAWHISQNWHYGIYKKEAVFSWKKSMIPWLKMTDNMLWWMFGDLYGFKRHEKTLNKYRSRYHTIESCGLHINKFIIWKNFIICGYMDGTVVYFMVNFEDDLRTAKMIAQKSASVKSTVNAIDASLENVIAGLDNGTVKIFRHPELLNVRTWDQICNMDINKRMLTGDDKKGEIYINLKDKVQSLSIDPTGITFAVGSAGINDVPLHVINVERYTMVDTMQHEWKYGAGILDMVWDDPNTLLTCGYDTYIRKWDLRTGRCVCSWVDPCDATLYCIASDNQYTMITGTQYNCLAILWDQRKTDFVQMYYVNSQESSRRSPIYSLQFDSTHLYCATDKRMIELNFSLRSNQKHDYKSLFAYLKNR